MPRIRRDMRLFPILSGSLSAMSHRHRAFPLPFVPLLRLTAAAVLAGTITIQFDQHLGAQAAAPVAVGDTERQTPAPPAPDGLAPLAGPNRDFPWWPWILAFPALGGLLWWLLRQPNPTSNTLALGTVGPIQLGSLAEEESQGDLARKSTGELEEKSGHPVADSVQAVDSPAQQAPPAQPATERRIILTPRSSHAAYAYWELPPSEVEALQRRNCGLALKVHDVTDIAQVDQQAPHTTEIVACATAAIGDCHLPILQGDRDYLAELGYQDDTSTWHALVRSEPVRVSAQPHTMPPQPTVAVSLPDLSPPETSPSATTPEPPTLGLDPDQGRVVNAAIPRPGTTAAMAFLVAQTCQIALARWEIPPDQVDDLKTGKRRLTVRLYDVTELPGFLASTPNSVQEFEAELAPQAERTLPIAVDDRDYLIEVGYVTGGGQWHVLAKSSPVRVPAC